MLRVALLAAVLAMTSSAFAMSPPPHCSQLAHDQRVTGFEPGMWISDLAGLVGFVFFVIDAKPDAIPGFLMADLVSLGPLLSFAGAGCIVRPDSESSQDPRVLPAFKTQEEARAYRDSAIRGEAFVMGLNVVASGVMLLFVHKPASRVTLGISTAFPLVYSLVNIRKFSAERDIDNSLPSEGAPPKARLEIVPEIDRVARQTAVGLALRMRF